VHKQIMNKYPLDAQAERTHTFRQHHTPKMMDGRLINFSFNLRVHLNDFLIASAHQQPLLNYTQTAIIEMFVLTEQITCFDYTCVGICSSDGGGGRVMDSHQLAQG